MADPAKTRVKLTNVGTGARSFFTAEREARILRPGETFEGEIFEADLADLSADLSRDGDADRDTGDDLDPNRPAEGSEHTGAGFAAGGGADAGRISAEAETLARANTKDDLLTIAKNEDVTVESDDNKNDLALKIARARAGIKPEAD